MAKRAKKTSTATTPRTTIVRYRTPTAGPIVIPRRRTANTAALRRKYESRLSRIRARARGAAKRQVHRLAAAGTGAAFAALRHYAPDILEKLTVGPLTPAATLGLLGYAAEEMGFLRGELASHAVTGLLTIGAYELTGELLGGVSGDTGFDFVPVG